MNHKKNNPKVKTEPAASNQSVSTYATYAKSIITWSIDKQLAFLMIIAFAFYANSLLNQYALDDGIVIEKNLYVQNGISGIKDIMTHDAYASFYEQMGAGQQLSGGRYRPLSIVTFAIEKALVGDSPFIRHLVNVLLFVGSIALLFHFLRNYLFIKLPNGGDLAFLSTLIFAIHPIHTEVIANVKSRDEIMSFLFITATFLFFYQYLQNKKTKTLIYAGITYFLALLSKEYAIMLVLLIPLSVYIFRDKSFTDSFKGTLLFFIVAGLYMFIRVKVVGASSIENTDVLNNPYMFAKKAEKLATKIYVLFLYFRYLVFPHPLSADYSYSQIAYRSFGSWDTWLSIIFHFSLIILGVKLFFKRHVLSFAIIFYLAFLALIGNIFMDIGATMGERLIYHSSLGFAIALGYGILVLTEKITTDTIKQRNTLYILLLIIGIPFGIKAFERNAVWENDITLFTHDVNVVPNSALANGNAGARYIDLSEKPENKDKSREYLEKSIGYLRRALQIHPRYVNSYINLGLAQLKMGRLDSAEIYLGKARELYPSNPIIKNISKAVANTYLNKGLAAGKQNNLDSAIIYINKASILDPTEFNTWYNLGGALYTGKRFEEASQAFAKALQINPNHQDAKNGYTACMAILQTQQK